MICKRIGQVLFIPAAGLWIAGLYYLFPAEPKLSRIEPVYQQEVAAEIPLQSSGLDTALIAAVKKFEGYSSKAFWDYQQYSIGYGTRAKSRDEEIDEPEAERRLIDELEKARALVDGLSVPLTRGQHKALTSLTFNAGSKWMQQGLGAAVKAGDWKEAQKIFLQYVHANGERLTGLVRRRAEEAKWFETEMLAGLEEEPTPLPQSKPVQIEKPVAVKQEPPKRRVVAREKDEDEEREARRERQREREAREEREERRQAAREREEREEKRQAAREREKRREAREEEEERREARRQREKKVASRDDDDDERDRRRRKRRDDD